jgi:hypothetical protein
MPECLHLVCLMLSICMCELSSNSSPAEEAWSVSQGLEGKGSTRLQAAGSPPDSASSTRGSGWTQADDRSRKQAISGVRRDEDAFPTHRGDAREWCASGPCHPRSHQPRRARTQRVRAIVRAGSYDQPPRRLCAALSRTRGATRRRPGVRRHHARCQPPARHHGHCPFRVCEEGGVGVGLSTA